jgi:hypothetical protein
VFFGTSLTRLIFSWQAVQQHIAARASAALDFSRCCAAVRAQLLQWAGGMLLHKATHARQQG